MAAFMFEKISSSAHCEPPPAAPETRPSGVLVKMLDRLPRIRARKNRGRIKRNESNGAPSAQD
ncbi:MAG: hypothetical protein J0H40_06175 [Rhizobiales bacterium]|nr:hypothetical protein [Hyphomicrobiales bacterium]